MEMTLEKTCLTCYKPIKGRVDKKFCTDYCRSMYNNRVNSEGAPYLRHINSILKRNRKILEEILPLQESAVKIHRTKLLESGFDFRYSTHIWTERSGLTYTCCYEFGYRILPDEMMLLIRTIQKGA